MKKWMIGLLAGLVQTAAYAAESALFVDEILTISDAIVMEGDTPRYYRDVQLEIGAHGDFKVIDGVEKQLAYIEEVSVAVLETDPVQVELDIVGYMSNPCVELNTAVTRKENTFYVAIGETVLQTLVACAQVVEPFDITLPLDVKGLPAGDYEVLVNDKSVEFTLN